MTNARGFTLIELLVSIGILAIMATIIAQVQWLATTGVRREERREAVMHAAHVALHRLQTDLAMAFILEPTLNALGRDVSPFQAGFIGQDNGDEDGLILTTLSGRRLVAGEHAADQREVEYRLQNIEDEDLLERNPYLKDTKQLMRREDRVLDDDVKTGGESQAIVQGVSKFTLEYWDATKGEWGAEWDSTSRATLNRMPRAVRISLEVVNPNRADETIRFQTIAPIELGPDPVKL